MDLILDTKNLKGWCRLLGSGVDLELSDSGHLWMNVGPGSQPAADLAGSKPEFALSAGTSGGTAGAFYPWFARCELAS